MADRTVSVNLRASVGQYLSAMATAGGATKSFGTTLSRVGAGMTRMVTLPILAAAGASTFMALKYEDAFTRIDAVSNASQKQIAGWKDEVLGMAGRTAQAPQELAEALYFLASAGLKNADIMPALEAAAKGAATGMGTLEGNARLVANVLNAYPKAGMKAVDVMDVLTSALKEGTAAPEEFTSAMGRILPIASKAGVGFDEIAASLSSLSNIGLDVNEGVTAMRGLLQSLVAPGSMAADTLKDIGISTEELRTVISEEGILGALRLLDERTKGNIDTMRKIVPNVRALTGQLGLTGQEAEKVDATFQKVTHSTAELEKAFETTKRGPMFEFKQAMADLQVVAIQVGQDILPVVTKIVSAVGQLARGFSNLPEGAQGAILWGALVMAALGPVLSLLGKLITAGKAAAGLFATGGAAAGLGQGTLFGAGAGAGGAGAGAGASLGAAPYIAVAAAIAAVAAGSSDAREPFEQLTREMIAGSAAAQDQAEGMVAAGEAAAKSSLEIAASTGVVTDWTGEAGMMVSAGTAAKMALEDVAVAARDGRDQMNDWGITLREGEKAAFDAAMATGDYTAALNVVRGAVARAQGALDNLNTSHDANRGSIDRHKGAIEGLAGAYRDIPGRVDTKVTADTGQAQAAVDRFIHSNDGRVIGVRVVVQGTSIAAVGGGHQAPHTGGVIGESGMRRLHGGGVIGSMPTLRGDEEVYVGQRGERVLSKPDVAALQAILGGGVMTAAGGAAAGGVIYVADIGDVTINDGSDLDDLVAAVTSGIASGARRERLARGDL